MDDAPRGSTRIERYAQHIVQAVTVAAIIGGAVAVVGMREDIAVMKNTMAIMKEQVSDLKAATADRYTATEARRERQPLIDAIADHEARIRLIERTTRMIPSDGGN
jgi:hypothetical protein